MRLSIIFYNQIERYPPTMAAIKTASSVFKSVNVVCLGKHDFDGIFAKNVKVIQLSDDDFASSKMIRVTQFIKFFWASLNEIRRSDWCLLYDYAAVIPGYIAKNVLRNRVKVWYHSHDVQSKNDGKRSKWSRIGGMLLNGINLELLTVPTSSRIQYFKNLKSSGISFSVLPNYPSLSLRSPQLKKAPFNDKINLLYQGRISEGHGLDNILECLGSQVRGLTIHLLLVGPKENVYFEKLTKKISDRKLSSFVEYLGEVNYFDLIQLTLKGHVGLSILEPINDNYATAGLASNKTFEYAMCGLPVIYFDSSEYRTAFAKLAWARPVKLSKESIMEQLNIIAANYGNLSDQALTDVKLNLNFDSVATPFFTSIVNGAYKE